MTIINGETQNIELDYVDKLKISAEKYNNITCMGLDPVMEVLPEKYSSRGISGFVDYVKNVVDRMKAREVIPSAFKPNEGFYTVHDNPKEGDFSGSLALANITNYIHEQLPDVPIILDNKRGDIDKSSRNYIKATFEGWHFDAMTLSPYLGSNSISPMKEFPDKGGYILALTSNPSSKEFQHHGEPKLFEKVLSLISNEYQGINTNLGAVVGATHMDELSTILQKFPNSLYLIPGVGSQGGDANTVINLIKANHKNPYLIRVNSSSGLTHPWAKSGEIPSDAVEKSVEAVENLNQLLRLN